ncbi:acetylornithine deacetylase [bacterium MnTg02]|nr:acetylornithine deacetylase [bacterium MnTg02]
MTPQPAAPKELLAKLVGFDTTSRDTNLPLIEFVQSYLGGFGVSSELVPNEQGNKASLFATIGPETTGGIGLSGHTDVVPVDGQSWSTDPFKLSEKDGLLYGRGTCDMKGFIACVLAAIPDFMGRDLKIPIHLLFSYDEEIGCIGVRPMISELGSHFPQPSIIVVGEPTEMNVVDAHKSINAFVTEVTGHEAHSSATHIGVNAIQIAAELISELDRIGEDMRARGGGHRFNPPYTTVHVGTIEGGTALNIVPKKCRFVWEFRGIPGMDEDEIGNRIQSFAAEKLIPKMHEVSDQTGIDIRRVNHVPAFHAPEGSTAVSLILKLAEKNETFTVSYGTEAGLFEHGNCPAVICGPGNIEQAHKPDEFVAISELDACMRFLRRLAAHAEAG